MTTPVVCWSSVAGFDGTLTWIPEDVAAVPAHCVCGALLQVTERTTASEQPIELTCDRAHRWRSTQRVLEERLATRTTGEPDRPKCARCGQFLSATRAEMRIDRCADCDRPRGRKSP